MVHYATKTALSLGRLHYPDLADRSPASLTDVSLRKRNPLTPKTLSPVGSKINRILQVYNHQFDNTRRDASCYLNRTEAERGSSALLKVKEASDVYELAAGPDCHIDFDRAGCGSSRGSRRADRSASSIKAAGKSFLVQTANARIQARRRSPEEIHLRGS